MASVQLSTKTHTVRSGTVATPQVSEAVFFTFEVSVQHGLAGKVVIPVPRQLCLPRAKQRVGNPVLNR